MSEFLNIYTVVKRKDLPKILSDGLHVNSLTESDLDHITFTSDYLELNDFVSKNNEYIILSFNTKYVSELNRNYTLNRIDESRFYTVERIDPKYLTKQTDYYMFEDIKNCDNLCESVVFNNWTYIFEKYGVTENLDAVIYKIADLLNDAYIGHMQNSRDEQMVNVQRTNETVIIDVNLSMISPSLSWFNFDDSTFKIKIHKYKSKNEKKVEPDTIYSEIDYKKSVETGQIVGSIYCSISEYPDCRRINVIDVEDFRNLIPYLRHEFNHLHKNVETLCYTKLSDYEFYENIYFKPDDDLSDDERKRKVYIRNVLKKDINYRNVVRLKDSIISSIWLKNLAEIIYMYGNGDERNANVEQYFEEHMLNPGNEHSRKKLNELRLFLQTFNPEYNEKVAIYDKFQSVFNFKHNLSNYGKDETNKYTRFYNLLKCKLYYYIDKTESLFDRIDKKYMFKLENKRNY